jgi:hypothetical protein
VRSHGCVLCFGTRRLVRSVRCAIHCERRVPGKVSVPCVILTIGAGFGRAHEQTCRRLPKFDCLFMRRAFRAALKLNE